MSRHTKEKRKKQRLKKEAEVKEDKTVFDIFSLLQTENLDTKPNMAKFLKSYVKCITGCPLSKPTFYPSFELKVSKAFVKFLDGHEAIFDFQQRDSQLKYVFFFKFEEVPTTQRERQLLEKFIDKLVQFNFIPKDSIAVVKLTKA